MEKIFIEARRKFKDNELNLNVLKKIPGKKISLASTIQYLNLVPKVSSFLKSIGKEVIIKKGAFYRAQVLGCNSSAFERTADSLLLLADGKFHAINNALQLQREMYIFNSYSLEFLSKKDIEKHNKITRAKQARFLSSKKVGIIASTKSGQKSKIVEGLKRRVEALGKKAFIFEADKINITEFENFPQIQIWVNTACYGLARDDKRIINFADLLPLLRPLTSQKQS
ncbi:hypothetical protein D6829_00440 [Candidatus Pacearchaeota archaeon]|nr:MAG: hypothetical protein D6829_00440 [Candidatus Pacearchaeota archaeon]